MVIVAPDVVLPGTSVVVVDAFLVTVDGLVVPDVVLTGTSVVVVVVVVVAVVAPVVVETNKKNSPVFLLGTTNLLITKI